MRTRSDHENICKSSLLILLLHLYNSSSRCKHRKEEKKGFRKQKEKTFTAKPCFCFCVPGERRRQAQILFDYVSNVSLLLTEGRTVLEYQKRKIFWDDTWWPNNKNEASIRLLGLKLNHHVVERGVDVKSVSPLLFRPSNRSQRRKANSVVPLQDGNRFFADLWVGRTLEQYIIRFGAYYRFPQGWALSFSSLLLPQCLHAVFFSLKKFSYVEILRSITHLVLCRRWVIFQIPYLNKSIY